MYIAKTMKYMRSDENMQLSIDGLRKLLALDFEVSFCLNNGLVEEGRVSLQSKLDNLLKLAKETKTCKNSI